MDVLNDLLNYDKIEQGNLQLQLKVLSGFQLVEKVFHEFGLAANSKNIRLGLSFSTKKTDSFDDSVASPSVKRPLDLPPDVQELRIVGDSVRLTQVLRNIMSNAVKFSPEQGSIDVSVVFDESRKERAPKPISLGKSNVVEAVYRGVLRVHVRDTGVGMTPEQLSKLFRENMQFNSNELQNGGGSGLGLFIAKGIMKQHNGALSAVSDGLNQGSTFSFSIPIWRVSEQTEEKHALLPNNPSDHPSTLEVSDTTPRAELSTSLRVLVVEDVKSNRKLLCRLLINRGHTCEEAENGLTAVEMVKAAEAGGNPYDSVLMDYEVCAESKTKNSMYVFTAHHLFLCLLDA